MADDEIDRHLEDIAGSRKLAQELKRNLETLRDRGDSPLSEMATDILAGRMGLRDVTRSSAYAIPLLETMDRYHEYESRLSDEQRIRLLKEAKERLSDDDRESIS